MILVRIIFTLFISTFICTTSFSQKDKNQKDKNFSQKAKKTDPDEKHFDVMKPSAIPNIGKASDATEAAKPAESDSGFEKYGSYDSDCFQLVSYEKLICLLKSCPECFNLVWIEKHDPFGPRGPVFGAGKPDPFGPVSGSYKPNPFDPRGPIGPVGEITVEIYR